MKDKTTRSFELIATIILSVYCVVMIVYAKTHPINTKVDGMRSYTFPVTMYSIMLGGCLILIAQNRMMAYKQKKAKAVMTSEEFEKLPEEIKLTFLYQLTDKRVWVTVGLIILYAALWKVLGFTISTLLFVTVESKVLKNDTPIWKGLLVALVAVLVIYLVFVRLFSISLPETFLRSIL